MRDIVVRMIILILSITVHEFGHAFVADRLGDRLPRMQGRVTLNPMAHADPFGTLAFPLIGMLLTGGASMGFGWGRPVEVNPVSFSRRFRMKTAHMFVAAAGPAMNILFAAVISLALLVMGRMGWLSNEQLVGGIIAAIHINVVLAFFNMLPTPPLDGGTVLFGLLPDRYHRHLQPLQQYGMYILFGIILIPGLSSILLAPARWTFDAWMTLLAGWL